MLDLTYPLLLDGATGTGLQAAGMPAGASTEQWVLENPQALIKLQRDYVAAGSQVIYAPTFGANRSLLQLHHIDTDVEKLNHQLIAISKEAVGDTAIIAGDMTTTGNSVFDEYEETLDIYREQAAAIKAAGLELVVGETLLSLDEGSAILEAAQEVGLSCFISFSVDQNGRNLSGQTLEHCLKEMQEKGAAAVGVNCSSGIDTLPPLLEKLVPELTVPVLVKANASLFKQGQMIGSVSPADYAEYIRRLREIGVRIVGGCCGSTPAHIAAIRSLLDSEKISANG